MQPICPHCQIEIPPDDVNIPKDVAQCRQCGQVFHVSILLDEAEIPAVDLKHPPQGCWYREEESGFQVGAKNGNFRAAVAVLLSAVLFFCVLFQPSLLFVVLGLFLFILALVLRRSSVGVTVKENRGTVFTEFGWRKRFNWSKVTGIAIRSFIRGIPVNRADVPSSYHIYIDKVIRLLGPESIDFGHTLADEQRIFIAGALRHRLRSQKPLLKKELIDELLWTS